ncbi:MAG: polyphosphate kinase 2 [Phaeodactylibacter sp.]|nr:polyphosphate kinase 2 [Phaeodactylibacter sp.]MCB9265984.1 polyphosphate kinase 2 [Lewinellaceae bacterium]MCB9290226.1 polyphosphate kinase 2 [Lewinellaceae bacterium]
MNDILFSNQDIAAISTREGLLAFLIEKEVDLQKIEERLIYKNELEKLQIELLKLQNWILKKKKRVVVLFEGRDAAGKGGAIRRFRRYLNPRSARGVALGKPSDIEKGQWYFRRHLKEMPNPGEIVFFDRSWYNRAVVEPVMGFCSQEEYERFIWQVPEFEHMLTEDGVKIIKLWFAISKEEQKKRLDARETDPLKQWKISPVDKKAREMWEEYTYYIREMLFKTHTDFSPWIIVKTDNKLVARLETIRYLLSLFDYDGKEKAETILFPDPNIVHRFYRSMLL